MCNESGKQPGGSDYGGEKGDTAAMPEDSSFANRALRHGLNKAMSEVAAWGRRKGWEPDPSRTFGDECALLTSEISEALEAFRDHRFERHYLNSAGERIVVVSDLHGDEMDAVDQEKCQGVAVRYADGAKPEGVASEFADVLIRLLHYCYVHGIDLAGEYEAKMAYNERRAFRHGGRSL